MLRPPSLSWFLYFFLCVYLILEYVLLDQYIGNLGDKKISDDGKFFYILFSLENGGSIFD